MSGESKRSFVHGDLKQSCLHLTSVSTNFGRVELKANVKVELDPIRKQVRLLKNSHRYAKQKAGEREPYRQYSEVLTNLLLPIVNFGTVFHWTLCRRKDSLLSFRSNMGSSGDNRRKINCQYEINMLDWCLFFFFFIKRFRVRNQRNKFKIQISKNSVISGRKINSTLGQPFFLSPASRFEFALAWSIEPNILSAEYGLKFLDRFVCAKGIDK